MMGADQPGNHDWTVLTMRDDGFSMERFETYSKMTDEWAKLKLEPSVRAVYVYDPSGRYFDSRVRTK